MCIQVLVFMIASNAVSFLSDIQLVVKIKSQLMRLWYLSHRRTAKGLAEAIAVRTHKVWKQTKSLTKDQTCSASGLLRMCV